ncbi:MAG: hypothetical protein PHT16_03005 [Candidatus Pacebacteria bacterium]|nr:hypothetical protein [Candidatus Paceibacterota bacterium]
MRDTNDERISKAVSTFDHILWESILRACGMATSKAFQQTGRSARVVYSIPDLDPNSAIYSEGIAQEVKSFLMYNRRVKKIGKRLYKLDEALKLCTHESYRIFLKRIFGEQQEKELDFVQKRIYEFRFHV